MCFLLISLIHEIHKGRDKYAIRGVRGWVWVRKITVRYTIEWIWANPLIFGLGWIG